MTGHRLAVVVLSLSAVLTAGRVSAQLPDTTASSHSAPIGRSVPQRAEVRPSSFRPLKVGKWLAASGAAGAAVYGFVRNGEADDAFTMLEEACGAAPQRCALRSPGGAYGDAEFENLYQDVLALDRKARNGLLLSQVGVAASVVLFLLDLHNDVPPPDIPYTPPRLRVGAARDGGVELRVRLPFSR